MRKKYFAVVSSLLCITALLAACGTAKTSTSSASTNSAPAPAASSSTSNTASSSAPSASSTTTTDKELVVYSAMGFDKDVTDAFQKKTGITVKLADSGTGPLLAKVQAEKPNPQWDIVWFDGNSSMQGLNDQGMLLKNYSPANMANYTDLGKGLEPSDHSYHPVTVTTSGALAYNTTLLQDSEAPKDWPDLLKPQYKGAVAMNNPSISGPTYTTVLNWVKIQNGVPQGEDFVSKMKANGMIVFDSNGPTLQNLIKGTVKIAVAQDSAIITAMQDPNNHLKIIYPTSGVATLSSNIAINAKAPHMDAAKQFVEYVLSPEAIKVAQASKNGGDATFESIIQGAPSKPGLRPDGIKWNTIDPIFGAQHENEIKTWFTQNIVQK
ncbi:extracellular solute-binding protein [Paenibacillus filicis]|uniref:Extracellular solute-binding protein n=1 Tax=Paenibacillus gyeongsangnamensis TaxID=3388067 RepID=A0ABT4Q5T3_9BACL|nr:extracellular solute-binding protein [Paenibacillus filicis]MCZ8512152.1 extracellular solute-binding protein [Paenibacillus filicis]